MWFFLWLGCATSTPADDSEAPELDDVARRERRAGAHHPSANEDKPKVGRWNKARKATDDEIAALEAIGYVGGEQQGRGLIGVTVNQDGVAPGLNLYVSGHTPEAVLMRADGTVLHKWSMPFEKAYPGRKVAKNVRGTDFWRRAAVLPDGDLLAIYEGQGLIRLDKDSRLEWAWDGLAHHDLHVMPDGIIWTLSRKAHVVPSVNPRHPVLEDFVTVLDADGNVQRQFSVLEAIQDSAHAALLERMPKPRGDIFHTNSIEVLDGRAAKANPAFTKGNLLLSSRAMSAIFIVDPATERVVWSHTGEYAKQHDPKVVEGGHMLVFDNLGPAGENSAVREYDLATMEQVWTHVGSDDAPFFTRFCGAAERLANGNTLVVESGYGRVFELDPSGRTVWEFYNPARTGDDGEFVAIIPDMVRIPESELTFLPSQ